MNLYGPTTLVPAVESSAGRHALEPTRQATIDKYPELRFALPRSVFDLALGVAIAEHVTPGDVIRDATQAAEELGLWLPPSRIEPRRDPLAIVKAKIPQGFLDQMLGAALSGYLELWRNDPSSRAKIQIASGANDNSPHPAG